MIFKDLNRSSKKLGTKNIFSIIIYYKLKSTISIKTIKSCCHNFIIITKKSSF